MSVQDQLLEAITGKYPELVVKKINVDNFIDIHIPSVFESRGTHLFFNTARNKIKLGIYCRDKEIVNFIVEKYAQLEEYSHGIRFAGNPQFDTVAEAIVAAEDLLNLMINNNDNDSSEPNTSGLVLASNYSTAVCELIKSQRVLCNFFFIPDLLRRLGFQVDPKLCFYYEENIIWAENGMKWNVLIDSDGFYSSQGGRDFKLLFDWDSLNEIKVKIDNDSNSILLGLFQDDGNYLTLSQDNGQSLLIVYYMYNYIMKDIIDEFRESPYIEWNKVRNMGINLVSFESYGELYNLFE